MSSFALQRDGNDEDIKQLRENVRRLRQQVRHMQDSLHTVQTTLLTVAHEEGSRRAWVLHDAYPRVRDCMEKPDPTDPSASSRNALQLELFQASITPLVDALKSFEAAHR